ncbi:hypothetical protein GCM10027082_29350 [Comamonas humi]
MPEFAHFIVPYANAPDPGLAGLATLTLPRLGQALKTLSTTDTDRGDEQQFAPPHEHALARALGLPATATPWAALQQQPQPGNDAWAFITPCHWRIGADQVRMDDPAQLQLSAAESDELLALLAPWFAEDGMELQPGGSGRWLARGEPFRGLDCASLDRAIGRDVRLWLPEVTQARLLQRLQSEMQMLLYTHPFTERRAERGLPPVNAFWVHGAGALPAGYQPPANRPQVLDALRAPALASDWAAWRSAWQQLDATGLAPLWEALAAGRPARLTLCGERHAVTLDNTAQPLWTRIKNQFKPQRATDLLQTL